MADTVNTTVVRNDHGRYVVHLTNESDGTGESAVTKVDVSTLTSTNGTTPTYTTVQRIEYSVFGMNYVTLEWDATANDEIAVLMGQGVIDFMPEGGITDPKSTGTTGDIVLTTDGHADGGGYDISIWLKLKS